MRRITAKTCYFLKIRRRRRNDRILRIKKERTQNFGRNKCFHINGSKKNNKNLMFFMLELAKEEGGYSKTNTKDKF